MFCTVIAFTLLTTTASASDGGDAAMQGANEWKIIGDNDYTYGIQPPWDEYHACVTPHAARMRAWQREQEAMDYWEADAILQ
jgi:hypothetical protein